MWKFPTSTMVSFRGVFFLGGCAKQGLSDTFYILEALLILTRTDPKSVFQHAIIRGKFGHPVHGVILKKKKLTLLTYYL